MNRHRIILVAAAGLCAALWTYACGDGATEPPPPAPDPPRPASVAVAPATAELTALGATVQLRAEVRDQNGQAMTGATVTWSSGRAAVATVDGSGLVTAAGNGTATITASAGRASGTATVTVAQSPDSVVVLPAEAAIAALGDTLRLVAEAFDANGRAVAGTAFSWESSDDAVATVDGSGLVTAVGNGTATITATAGSASGAAAVTVMQAPDSVVVSPAEGTIAALGDTLRLAAEAFDANRHAISGVEFSWASSDGAVATVDGSGLVTAAGNGTATITASAGSASGSAAVTVEQEPDAGITEVYLRVERVRPGIDGTTLMSAPVIEQAWLRAGEGLVLSALVRCKDGGTYAAGRFDAPCFTETDPVFWESSDVDVAPVDLGYSEFFAHRSAGEVRSGTCQRL